MSKKYKEQHLNGRKDFWNTNFNPITGFRVPNNYHCLVKTKFNGELKAEYNFNTL
jgi:hypothetical protein